MPRGNNISMARPPGQIEILIHVFGKFVTDGSAENHFKRVTII